MQDRRKLNAAQTMSAELRENKTRSNFCGPHWEATQKERLLQLVYEFKKGLCCRDFAGLLLKLCSNLI